MKRYTLAMLAKDIKRNHESAIGCDGCPSRNECAKRFGDNSEPGTLADFRNLAKDYWNVGSVTELDDDYIVIG